MTFCECRGSALTRRGQANPADTVQMIPRTRVGNPFCKQGETDRNAMLGRERQGNNIRASLASSGVAGFEILGAEFSAPKLPQCVRQRTHKRKQVKQAVLLLLLPLVPGTEKYSCRPPHLLLPSVFLLPEGTGKGQSCSISQWGRYAPSET